MKLQLFRVLPAAVTGTLLVAALGMALDRLAAAPITVATLRATLEGFPLFLTAIGALMAPVGVRVQRRAEASGEKAYEHNQRQISELITPTDIASRVLFDHLKREIESTSKAIQNETTNVHLKTGNALEMIGLWILALGAFLAVLNWRVI